MSVERIHRHPMKRMGTTEEVAETCLFLANKKSSFISEANLMVDIPHSEVHYPTKLVE